MLNAESYSTSTRIVALAAMLSVIVGEAGPGQFSSLLAPRPAVADDALPGNADEPSDNRLRAMVAIHYHAYAAKNLVPPEVDRSRLGVMPLSQAIDFLIADSIGNPLGRSRRRRAIALLAGYLDAANAEATTPWERLVAKNSTYEAIRGRLLTESAASPAERVRIAYEMLGDLPVGGGGSGDENIELEIPGCGPTSITPDDPEIKAQTATTGISVTVTKSVDEVRKRLDPQEWDRFNRFFYPAERTYLVPEPKPTSIAPCAQFDGVKPLAAASPLPPGSYFDDRYLYEHAGCPNCKRFAFKTVLKVQAQPGTAACESVDCQCSGCALEYQACYGLQQPLSSCVDGETPILTVDSGHLSACRIAAAESSIRTRKKIQFKEASASVAAFFGFYLGQAEIVASVTEQLCCDEPKCWQ